MALTARSGIVLVLVVGVTALFVVSALAPVVSSMPLATPAQATSGGTAAAAGSVGSAGSSSAGAGSALAAPSVASPPSSPHPGVLDVYEVAPAGATTEDPAVAYDTTSEEPILNVYETLVSYNGSSAATFVPTVATCVPGTSQCTADYGSNLTADPSSNGVPVAWTFVIDPAAHFYDPATGSSWPVFPSDVVFSIARTLAFADQPYVGKTPGWILAQALLPNGSAGWDSGIHAPFNNTPQHVLGSMRVNDSAYCPASAMNGVTGNGCVTFLANGSETTWPYFLDFVASGLGASIVPCGWFTAQSAGIPGWAGSEAGHGDGSCLLPDGGTTTNATAWSAYLSGLSPTAWDSFEELENSPGWPAPQPNVQWNMVGSGPYAAEIVPGTGYELERSPDYQQPSGCSGAAGFAQYPGTCDPAPHAFDSQVNVFWEPSDVVGLSEYGAGQADFAGITNLTELVNLEHAGKLDIYTFPTLDEFFSPIDLDFNETAYVENFPAQPIQTIPSTAFTDLGLRNFLADAYPYAEAQSSVYTVDGIQTVINSGGPIPFGMGNFYPTNISYPFGLNGGVPDPNPADVGGAAWWWAQITNPSSPYYDAQLTACSASTPCTYFLPTLDGDPGAQHIANDWVAEVESLSGGAIAPFSGPLSLCDLFDCVLDKNYSDYPTLLSDGWSPDYEDPSDYTMPILAPNGVYPGPDSVEAELSTATTDNVSACGHAAVTFADLLYWAHAADPSNTSVGTLNESCQGVAYGVMAGYLSLTASGSGSASMRVLLYNLIEQISNALALNVFEGEENAVTSAAPWIAGASVNTNPMIGGGGDQLWFQIRYNPTESAVTFKETGLPSGSTWQVTTGSPGQTRNQTLSNLTTAKGGSITAYAPNGTFRYSFTAPVGFGAVRVTGSGQPTFAVLNVSYDAAGYALTVHFGALESVNFIELTSPTWPGLVSGTSWSVTLGPAHLTGALGATNSTTGGSVGFTLPAGATYKFQVAAPSIDKAAGGHGSFTVPDHALTKTVKFAEFTATVTFTESGLPAHTGWTVAITGAENLTLSGTTASLSFHAINGSYSYTVAAVGSRTPTPDGGTYSVAAPMAVHERIVFTDPAGPEGPAFGPAANAPAALPTEIVRELPARLSGSGR